MTGEQYRVMKYVSHSGQVPIVQQYSYLSHQGQTHLGYKIYSWEYLWIVRTITLEYMWIVALGQSPNNWMPENSITDNDIEV